MSVQPDSSRLNSEGRRNRRSRNNVIAARSTQSRLLSGPLFLLFDPRGRLPNLNRLNYRAIATEVSNITVPANRLSHLTDKG
jgi:hypothetical protein